MFHWYKLAEERIQASMRDGEFDDLEGRGKPLVLEDDSMVPEELRMAYKMLRNSGHLPPELHDAKEIRDAAELLAGCEDEQTRYRQLRKLNYLIMRFNQKYNKSFELDMDSPYYDKVVERVRLGDRKKDAGA